MPIELSLAHSRGGAPREAWYVYHLETPPMSTTTTRLSTCTPARKLTHIAEVGTGPWGDRAILLPSHSYGWIK